MANLPTLTQDLRDEIIGDIQALNIPGVDPAYVKKLGAFPQTRGAILVSVDDLLEPQNVADTIRLMAVSIYCCTYVPQDRDGDFLDTITSYIETYTREPRQFLPHAGFMQVRQSQMTGRSTRLDQYGDQAWFVCEFTMTIPYGKPTYPYSIPSASPSPQEP